MLLNILLQEEIEQSVEQYSFEFTIIYLPKWNLRLFEIDLLWVIWLNISFSYFIVYLFWYLPFGLLQIFGKMGYYES